MEINLEINPVFRPAHTSTARYRVYWGSAGSGKSFDIAQNLILRLMQDQGRNLLCVRKAEVTNRDSTFSELRKAINNLGVEAYWTFTENPLRMTCYNGNRIIFRGMKDAGEKEKIKSITTPHGTLTDVWLEEATELTPDDFEIIDDRLRGALPKDQFYQLTLSFNPVSASHWIKQRFFDYEDSNVFTVHSTYMDNRFIDAQYHERMMRRRDLDPQGYQVYGLGQWGETRGIILENWEVTEVSKDLSHYDDIAVGQDFGYSHANALLLLGMKDGDIYIIKEIYVHQHHTAQVIDLARKAYIPTNAMMWCDAAEPDRIQEWQGANYMAQAAEKGPGSVNAQIDWLKQRKIYIDPKAVNTVNEIRQWKWRYDATNDRELDEPVNINDDAMAALRYGVNGWRTQGEIIIMSKYEGGL